MAATLQLPHQPERVAEKVLRRAQVSKMTRALQDRLALANLKIQNGWEHMSLDVIEPQVEERLRRKRPASSNDTISDSASTTSSRLHSSSGGVNSSPLTAPMFSDDYNASPTKKRFRSNDMTNVASSGAISGRRTRFTNTAKTSWKKSNNLPESSPIRPAKHARFPANHVSQLSFISTGSTIPDEEPPSPQTSEDDDADLPLHSFNVSSSTRLASSPPRTPPPDRRMRKTASVSWSRTPKHDGEGADLLLYLANSPSAGAIKTPIMPPSTPPSKSTPLPSSHMTPGTSGFMGWAPTTPGMNFNFADFVNVTPSPAQGPWSRTPVVSRTPGTSLDARRKSSYAATSITSPNLTRSNRGEGLGMELGGELLSSQ